MKTRFLTVLIGITLTLSMILGILVGCGTPATPTATPTGTSTVKPTATATVKPTTTAPTPTKTGEVIKLRMQSAWSTGNFYWAEQEFVNNVKIASNGRLIFDLLPTGAIVSRTEMADAVRTGAIESCGTVASLASKDIMFSASDPTMSILSALCYYNYWDYKDTTGDPRRYGQKFRDDLYAKWNIKVLNLTLTDPEVEYMANKKIVTPADWKGVTWRTSGMSAEVTAKWGAKPVNIPTTDVYSALQTGVIDAGEADGPFTNWDQGFQDITKYWGFPGMHTHGGSGPIMINLDVWNKLSADLQKICENAAYQSLVHYFTFGFTEDAKIMPKLIDKGINVVYQSPATQMDWHNTMIVVAKETYGPKNPNFMPTMEEIWAFKYMIEAYEDLQTPAYDSTYPGKKESIKGILWQ